MEEEWILIRDDLEMNAKWFIEYRFMGLSMRPELINKEIALSNGNIRKIVPRVATDGKGQLLKRHVYVFKPGISVAITPVGDELKGIYSYTNKKTYTESSLDTEIDKLNRRMRLIGSDRQFSTDGVSLVQIIDIDELKKEDASSRNIKIKRKSSSIRDTCMIKECVDINVDRLDFLNIRSYEFKGVRLIGNKHLRYIEVNPIDSYKLNMGEGVTCEMIQNANLTASDMNKIKRIYNCSISENFVDLSNIDYISSMGLMLGENTGSETHIHFGDKFVIMSTNSIFRIEEKDLRITYSNPDMSCVLRKFAHRANGVMGKVKLVYEGR